MLIQRGFVDSLVSRKGCIQYYALLNPVDRRGKKISLNSWLLMLKLSPIHLKLCDIFVRMLHRTLPVTDIEAECRVSATFPFNSILLPYINTSHERKKVSPDSLFILHIFPCQKKDPLSSSG